MIPFLRPCKANANPVLQQGIIRCAHDPWRWPCKANANPLSRVIFVFIVPLSKQALNGNSENKKTNRPQAVGLHWLCGERGIRTPGSPEGEQRFSRPPHSTTLPSLQYISRIYHGVYPAQRDHLSINRVFGLQI